MRSFLRLMAACVPLTVAGLAMADSHAHEKQVAKLHGLLDQYVSAVNNLDLELAKRIWSQKADISFIQPRGHQKGWADIEANFYLGAMANFSSRELRLKNIQIRLLDENTAWGDFYWDFDAVFAKDGSAIQTTGRESQVWRKEADGWKIVHVHYSGPPTRREREGF